MTLDHATPGSPQPVRARSHLRAGEEKPNQPEKGGVLWGEDQVATQLPGQSNADYTTTKLETHILATKVIDTYLCPNQNNLMLDYLDGFLWIIFF